MIDIHTPNTEEAVHDTPAADLRDPLVDPLVGDSDAVQFDDGGAFDSGNVFGDGWQKGRGVTSGGGTPTTQVKAEWKGDMS